MRKYFASYLLQIILGILCASKTSFAKSNSTSFKSEAPSLESFQFSQLILNENDLAELSADDRTTYLMMTIGLGQIIEGSQMLTSEKELEQFESADLELNEKSVVTADEKKLTKKSLLDIAFNQVVQNSEASLLRYLVYLPKAVTFAKDTILPHATQFVRDVVIRLSTLASKAKTGGGAAGNTAASNAASVKKAEGEFKELFKLADEAAVAFSNSKNASPKVRELLKARSVIASTELDKAFNVLRGAGKSSSEIMKLGTASGFSKVGALTTVGTLGTAGFGVDTILGEGAGSEIVVNGVKYAIKYLGLEEYARMIGIDATALGGIDPDLKTDQDRSDLKKRKAVTASAEEGNSCIYGGYGSIWVKKKSGKVKCARPSASHNEMCEGFQCPTYGIVFKKPEINVQLCLPMQPNQILTVRCSEKLVSLLEKQKAMLDQDEVGKYLKNLRSVLKKIEAQSVMKDDSGKVKTIFKYCSEPVLAQQIECDAIRKLVSFAKGTQIPATIARNAAAAESGQSENLDKSKDQSVKK